MKQIYSNAFANTFEAMQCMCWTVLYYDFDFDKDKLINFQKGLTNKDKIIDDKQKFFDVEQMLQTDYDIDCEKLAISFPYISKMKMAAYNNKNVKGTMAVKSACDNAIKTFLVIFFYELIKEWGYEREELLECYE